MIEVNKKHKGRMSISYDITLACNNRCSYCYMLDRLDNSATFNHEVFDKFKKAFNELDRTNNIELMLLGGDPLFIDEIVRINELDLTNVKLVISTNLNYSPEILDHRLGLIENVEHVISCSYHESSNPSWVMRNVGYIHEKFKNIGVTFITSPENFLRISDTIKLIRRMGVPYTIDPIYYNNGVIRTRFDRESYGDNYDLLVDLLDGSKDPNELMFGDKILTDSEIYEYDIRRISYIYFTLCEPNLLGVGYNGSVSTTCGYECTYDITDGLKKHKQILCIDNHCNCDVTSYKKLLRPRDRDANKKFHEHFGD